MSALDIQIGGGHYKQLKIQPVEYILANNIGYVEGNVIKYVTRWKDKNGIADLEKAKHYLDLLIEQQQKVVDAAADRLLHGSNGLENFQLQEGVPYGGHTPSSFLAAIQSQSQSASSSKE